MIDVGGGFRGIYAAGVLDRCLEDGVQFDLGIGISAGSANLASFAAGQKGRNRRFYTQYGFRKQYLSFGNYVRKRSYVDMNYVYGVLSNSDGEDPLDYPALRNNPMDFIVVAADAITGEARYFEKKDLWLNHYDILMASSSIPFVCQPHMIDGIPYYDGALGDPVPAEKAFELGCDRVVVILTKPESVFRNPKKDRLVAAGIRRKYPLAAEKLCERARRYNEGVSQVQEYVRQGKALIVAPDDTCGVDTLKRDKESLGLLYEKGCQDGHKILNFLSKTA